MRFAPLAVLAVTSLCALSSPSYAAEDGAAAGAVTGAVGGAVVGGPIGAVVGGVGGAVIGGAASGPDRRETVVVPVEPSCSTTTVTRENTYGDSTTTRRTNC